MERLIVFARTPAPGEVKTRIAKTAGAKRALEIYHELLSLLFHNLATIPQKEIAFTPPDSAHSWNSLPPGWDLNPQAEGDLGHRMIHAFERGFTLGSRKVVIIGSDCPEVAAADIQSAFAFLENHDLVLGPAEDGGYWLVGLNTPQPSLLLGISWSTSIVLEQTLKKATEKSLRVKLLRRLSDIDTEQDWMNYQASLQPDLPANSNLSSL